MPATAKSVKHPAQGITIARYLKPFPRPIRQMTEEALRVLTRIVPELDARVYPGWKLIGLRVPHARKLRYIGYLYPTESLLRLGFEQGVLIADPARLLKGSGSQVRYLELRTPGDLRDEQLAPYVLEAVHLATQHKGGRT